jgi:Putative rRNA methylase
MINFNSHLTLAHDYWKQYLKPGARAIDGTCGNGKDSLFIAKIILTEQGGELCCFDIQKKAIETTKSLLKENLSQKQFERVVFYEQSHERFPKELFGTDLIVYNFGYLPGSDKTITTMTSSSLSSIENGLSLLSEGGMMSLTCYPGHEEGEKEEKATFAFCETLENERWKISYHKQLNKKSAPSLIIIQKKAFN